jgi:hypothetical protein
LFQESQIDSIYIKLKTIDNIIVFKKPNIPDSLNYKQNVRVGDLVLIAKLGYTIHVKTEEIDWSLASTLFCFCLNFFQIKIIP